MPGNPVFSEADTTFEGILIIEANIQVITVPPDTIEMDEYQKRFDNEVMPRAQKALHDALVKATQEAFPGVPVKF